MSLFAVLAVDNGTDDLTLCSGTDDLTLCSLLFNAFLRIFLTPN